MGGILPSACRVRSAKENDERATDNATVATGEAATAAPPPLKKPAVRGGDRCAVCDCKLPLTACMQSRCKCGQLFCGAHMHGHVCSFDYRAVARDRLQKEHPTIAPAKLRD